MTEPSSKPPKAVDLQTTALGLTANAAERVMQFVQGVVPFFAWWVCFRPLLLLFGTSHIQYRAPPGSDPLAAPVLKPYPFKYRIDFDKASHRIGYCFMNKILAVGQAIGGVHRGAAVYERLLTWNPRIPVIGYRQDKYILTIEKLGATAADLSRPWDVLWFSSPNPFGRFQIVSKEVEEKPGRPPQGGLQVTIRAVWISGPAIGSAFEVDRAPLHPMLEKEGAPLHPHQIYAPPSNACRLCFVGDFCWSGALTPGLR